VKRTVHSNTFAQADNSRFHNSYNPIGNSGHRRRKPRKRYSIEIRRQIRISDR
jgi:hypothetical protein